ncbi:MAG: MBL fold metallo-hydrolase [Polaromonas sp.]|uniref:MBL fold metallo-hydrolase n=1 Tax=Polaromonas sp. TaxID=1869339 RepID=UPI0024895D4A|nr:MBL fold metallo-hydrolase [Polaromonas sp.]MDI1237324.1 MBL fold metallo-hydrolase [Polaromonas sp.]MDI1341966.1 MBL fold metallo-hydrolase [Polaromonas sp.]
MTKKLRTDIRRLVLMGLLTLAPAAHAVDVNFKPVSDGVYAYVGDKGPRSHDNEGLNANIGLIVTPAGAVLIDSGATYQSARKIHEAVRRVTPQPIQWVINTGGQDHRWLGNGYFKEQGAEIIAHASARADMLARGGDHLAALTATLKERAAGTMPTLPTRLIDGNDAQLELGGITLELRHRGGGHTPGDMMVWLPSRNVLFSGDIVYVDRLLGVIPVSNTSAWLAMFKVVEDLKPQRIVPGHGEVTDLATAAADTRDYLLALRAHMRKAVDEGTDVSAAVKSFNALPFMRLLNAGELLPGNGSRTYLELERE